MSSTRRLSLAWVCVGLAAPLLLVPTRLWPLGAALATLGIAAAWGVRSARLAVDELAVGGLLLLGVVSMAAVTSDPAAGLPRLLALTLATAVYLLIKRTAAGPKAMLVVAVGLSVGAAAVACVAFVATDWPEPYAKAALLVPIYRRLPRLDVLVPSSQGTVAGLSANEIAAVGASFLPILLALPLVVRRAALARGGRWVAVASAVVAAPLFALYLLLSASRAAWLAAATGFVVWLWLAFPARRRATLLLVAIGVMVAGLALQVGAVRSAALTTDLLWPQDLWGRPTRYEIWSRAWALLTSNPLIGVGLNAFPTRAGFVRTGDQGVPHAHDLWLQIGLDFGLPGVVLVLALLARFAAAVRRGLASAELRVLAAATAGGVVAYLVFGLIDAVAVGAKPTALIWALVALGVSTGRPATRSVAHPAAERLETGRRPEVALGLPQVGSPSP